MRMMSRFVCNRRCSTSDIWSVGSTVVELLTGSPPYYNLEAMAAMYRIVVDPVPPLPSNIGSDLRDFLLLCFNKVCYYINTVVTSIYAHFCRIRPPDPVPVLFCDTPGSPTTTKTAGMIMRQSGMYRKPLHQMKTNFGITTFRMFLSLSLFRSHIFPSLYLVLMLIIASLD